MDYGFTAEQIETLVAIESPRAEFFRRITRRSIEFIDQFLGKRVLIVPDALAVAVALEPDIVLKAETHHVQVELAGQHTRGQTTVDWFDLTGHEPNANLVLEVDANRLWELMQAALR
jgi:purine nucleosidase